LKRTDGAQKAPEEAVMATMSALKATVVDIESGQPRTSNEPEVMIDADALWRDYATNPYAADAKYLNRALAIELRPFRIVRLPNGLPTFVYQAWGRIRIRAFAGDSEIDKIAVLAKELDSAVILRGACEGLADGVVLLGACTLVDPASVSDAA
jgi:hypothetical protein